MVLKKRLFSGLMAAMILALAACGGEKTPAAPADSAPAQAGDPVQQADSASLTE